MSENTEVTTESTTDQSVTAIDAALQAARKRKAAKATPNADGTPAAPAAGTPRPRITEEEHSARQAKIAEQRAARKTEREAKRAEKLAARSANTRPAHLAKVQAAASKLGALSEDAQLLFNEATTNLSAADLTVLAAHINHFNRENSTIRALNTKLEAGQRVTVTGGDPRFIGQVGTLTKVQRIRCYVQLDGVEKVHYAFTSDVAPAAAAESEAQAEAV